jgi:acyl-CoA dehydrogenase
MRERSYLQWPFFDAAHRTFARDLDAWVSARPPADEENSDDALRVWVRALGEAGWLRYTVPQAYGGALRGLDVRSLCLARERLAYRSGLGDFAFAMQGLGSGPITLFGSEELRARWLPRVATGGAIAALAISERDAGSDVAALATTAKRDGDGGYVLDGEKTWISNAGIADLYVVFARTGPDGHRGLSAFIVPADTKGLALAEKIETIAPHPLGTLRFERCRIPTDALIGAEGDGFKIAMATLDVFRSTVGAAALGFARRALDETIAHVNSRKLFGAPLAALQMTQARIADMALDVDASALLVYRAAWTKDGGAARVDREAAMAKWYATEAAGRVADSAVQLFGGRGVTRGEIVERIYRDVRSLRIYEGATEVQQVIVARRTLQSSEVR